MILFDVFNVFGVYWDLGELFLIFIVKCDLNDGRVVVFVLL